MGEEDAGDGFLELVVSSRLLGQFLWKRCPRFVQLLRQIPAVLGLEHADGA